MPPPAAAHSSRHMLFCKKREIMAHTYIVTHCSLLPSPSDGILLTIPPSFSSVWPRDSRPHKGTWLLPQLSWFKTTSPTILPSPSIISWRDSNNRNCSVLFLLQAYSFHAHLGLLYFSSSATLSFTRGKVPVTATKSRYLEKHRKGMTKGFFSNMFTQLLVVQAAM